MSATLLPFPGNPGAPVVPLPRDHFGLVRPEDRSQQERIRDAAREARNALDGRHIDPELKAELAAKVGVVAEMCEHLATQAKFLGELRAAVTLREHQGLLETLSAELVP